MNPRFKVELVKLSEPIGNVGHALLVCPRCLKGLGVSMLMLMGKDSIICEAMLGGTYTKCKGHYYFDVNTSELEFVGTQETRTKTFDPNKPWIPPKEIYLPDGEAPKPKGVPWKYDTI